MACRTPLPAASSFSEGRVVGLASAFCTPWTSSSFAALPQHPPSGRAAATPSLAVGSGSLLGTRRGRSYSRRRRSEPLRCGLTRLSGDAGHRVLPVLATRDQWSHYWGGSDVQRVGKFFEVTAVAFLGLWACYFASFFLGVATMTVIGTSFLFYWLLAPNVTSFRRNRALRGRIAPYPGADGNSVAIFRARVASATEEYHPVTGQPVFLRMVIEDEDGRALKFRTRTRAEYARVRPGMVAEAILVSPDERFEEILGVSDTFIPAANVWVGEYPYLDKVVMRRLLASRDSKRRRRRRNGAEGDPQGYGEEEADELNPMTYRDSWTQTRPDGPSATGAAAGERDIAGGLPPPHLTEKFGVASVSSGFDTLYGEGGSLDDEPYFEGVGSAGFSEVDGSAAGRPRGRQQWERVSGRPRPRRRPPAAAARSSREDEGERWGDRRVRGEASFGREWESEEYGGTTLFGGERSDDSRMATGRKRRL